MTHILSATPLLSIHVAPFCDIATVQAAKRVTAPFIAWDWAMPEPTCGLVLGERAGHRASIAEPPVDEQDTQLSPTVGR